MSVNDNQIIDYPTRKKIDACVRRTMVSLENESTAVRETPNAVFQRFLKMFVALKPMFAFFSTFAVVPKSWRAMFTVFVQVIEVLVELGPNVTLQFKAGKDLEPAV